MKRKTTRYIPLAIMIAMMTAGCAPTAPSPSGSAQAPALEQKSEANTLAGKIVGKSNKAKTISIEVGKEGEAKTLQVRFDDKTSGLEYAADGEAAVITFTMRSGERVATSIKPKLAKLPEGVTEIKIDELRDLMGGNSDFLLIDSRPEKRYAQSHLPGAVSITVEQMEKDAAGLLPKDKDRLLVFYCGGYT